jgi:hypothetical protein
MSNGNQHGWKWCNKCQGMVYGGNPSPGPCPAGGDHSHTGSADYSISYGSGPYTGATQGNWRWCDKCQGLWYAGNPSGGHCPAGGSHSHTGSSDYWLDTSTVFEYPQQDNWRWCDKCEGLWYAGNPSAGHCPAGGSHSHTGSGNYLLYMDAPP